MNPPRAVFASFPPGAQKVPRFEIRGCSNPETQRSASSPDKSIDRHTGRIYCPIKRAISGDARREQAWRFRWQLVYVSGQQRTGISSSDSYAVDGFRPWQIRLPATWLPRQVALVKPL